MADELPRINHVWPIDESATLVIGWADGTRTPIDLTGVIARIKAFAPLTDPELFRQARVIAYGSGIGWPNGLDYSADSLWMVAEEQRAMTTEEFRAWQDKLGLTVIEAAEILGFSPRTIKTYRTGFGIIPKAVTALCRSTLRDPTVFGAHFRPLAKSRRGRPRKSA